MSYGYTIMVAMLQAVLIFVRPLTDESTARHRGRRASATVAPPESANTARRWAARTRESKLLLLGLAGGWPGSLVAANGAAVWWWPGR